MTSTRMKYTVIFASILALLVQITACTSTRTASVDIASESKKLDLHAGDEISVITTRRERFKMVVTEIHLDGLDGKTLHWHASKVSADKDVHIHYGDLAFVQLDRVSPARTAGMVASVTLVGAMVAAIVVAPVPLVVP